jgi:tRNA threonylcarbamoyl adenosine modification protein YeaZ
MKREELLPAVALDAARRPGTFALWSGGAPVAHALDAARAHASDLPAALQARLVEQRLHARDLRAIVVGNGPGSFTGLRVAAAFAFGLARGSGALLKAVPHAAAVGYALLADGEEGLWAHDLRAGGIALARCRKRGDELELLEPARARSVVEARSEIAHAATLLGDAEARAALGCAADDARWRDSASAQIELALLELGLRSLERAGADPPSALEPLYLRAFGQKA